MPQLAILLTGAEAHDYPVAKQSDPQSEAVETYATRLAYDGDGVRQQLDQRETKSVIPPQQKAPARLQQAPQAPASAPKLMRS